MNQNTEIKAATRLMKSTGDDLSLLGFGCMRFPRKGTRFDVEAVERLVTYAIENGINYFDTAYLYSGSEEALGSALAKTDINGRKLRERVKIATKLAQITIKTREGMDKMFDTSLKRLQTDYIDYYLIHSLTSYADWEKMKKLDVYDFIEKKRSSGAIKHIGFSWHGNLAEFKQVADDYNWDFCQIQLNYLDENFQAGIKGLNYAVQKGLGIVIMEPLRGGTLAGNLPPEAARIISDYKDENGNTRSAVYWGLRWVMDKPEINVVLSGMNTMEQLIENISIANETKPNSLNEQDISMITNVANIYKSNIKVPCTGCAYCIPCPCGVNIPACFAAYNAKAMFGGTNESFKYLFLTGGKKPSRASQCKRCGICEKNCPQNIKITDSLSDIVKTMEKSWLKIPVGIVLKIMGK